MSESTVPPPMPGVAPIPPAAPDNRIPPAMPDNRIPPATPDNRIPGQNPMADGVPTPGARSRPLTYACSGCGARVEFAPGTGALRCPYCQHEEPVVPAARSIQEHPFDALAQRPRQALAAHVWNCQKCGATTDSDLLATRCQF